MSWQVSLALRGDLQKFMDAEHRAGKSAVTTIIRRRTTNLKNDLRRQVKRAGLSERLANAVRGDVYPRRGASLNAAGRVSSKAVVKRSGGSSDLIQVLDQGATITASGGRALAIPLPAAGRGRGVRGDPISRTPQNFPPGTFYAVPGRRAGIAILRFRAGEKKGLAAFVLVRQVRLKKKIDIDRAYSKAVRGIDDAIVTQWERNSARVETRFGVDF